MTDLLTRRSREELLQKLEGKTPEQLLEIIAEEVETAYKAGYARLNMLTNECLDTEALNSALSEVSFPLEEFTEKTAYVEELFSS